MHHRPTLAVIVTALASTAFAGNLVDNGSFESNGLVGGTQGYTSRSGLYAGTGDVTDWSFGGIAGVTGSTSVLGEQRAEDGSYYAFLQSGGGKVASLSETLTGLRVGQQYSLSFFADHRYAWNAAGQDTLSVTVGGTKYSTPVTETGWTQFDTTFTATSSSELLTFSIPASPTGAGGSTYIDNIQIPPPRSVPGPAALLPFALGLLRRRRAG